MACSNVAAIPEIVGDAALTYDPRKPEKIAEALLRITGDDDLRRNLVEKGRLRAAQFTWDNTARATGRVLRQGSRRALRQIMRQP